MPYSFQEQLAIANGFDDYFKLSTTETEPVLAIHDNLTINDKLDEIGTVAREITKNAPEKARDLSLRLLSYARTILSEHDHALYPMAATIAAYADQYCSDARVNREANDFFDDLHQLFSNMVPDNEAGWIGFNQRVFRTYHCAARWIDLDTDLGTDIYDSADQALDHLLGSDINIYMREITDAADMAGVLPQVTEMLITHVAEAVDITCAAAALEDADKAEVYKDLSGMIGTIGTLTNNLDAENPLFYPFMRQFEIALCSMYKLSAETAKGFLDYYIENEEPENEDPAVVVQPEFAAFVTQAKADILALEKKFEPVEFVEPKSRFEPIRPLNIWLPKPLLRVASAALLMLAKPR